jgi:propanediol dehydratase small subunit
MKRRVQIWCIAAATWPGIALADQGPPPVVATLASTADTGLLALSDESLGDLRGGWAVVSANQTLSAISTGSVLNGDFTAGAVSISDNALSNFNGFGNVVINTGAQNNLQAGMNITINFGQ